MAGPESRDAEEMVRHLKWSPARKQIARKPFELASQPILSMYKVEERRASLSWGELAVTTANRKGLLLALMNGCPGFGEDLIEIVTVF
jgi:hypothetical protein